MPPFTWPESPQLLTEQGAGAFFIHKVLAVLLTDLREVRRILEIDPANTEEDLKLTLFVEWASNWLEEILNRDFSYKSRTQYYRGTNTQKLVLRNRPVYPAPPSPYSAIQVIYDSMGNFGQAPGSFQNNPAATPLTYGVDYTVQIDQDDQVSSRSAVLWRVGQVWIKPSVRQTGFLAPFIGEDVGSYQVVYTAGHTVDTLPAIMRMACTTIITKLRYFFPLGMPLSSESYEDRSIGILAEAKNYIVSPELRSMVLSSMRNWKF